MVDLNETQNQPQKQFFEQLKKARAGMLHVENSGLHSQPMAHQHEDGSTSLWFYTKTDAAVVGAIREGKQTAHYIIMSEDQDYQACVMGHIREINDRSKVDQFWSPMVAAWFEGDQDDPVLTMLELQLENGAAWGSTDNSMKFGWEIAKANLTGGQPDVGVHKEFAIR